MIRRLFVALSLAGVAIATVLVLRGSGGPEALFVLSAGNHLAALGAMVLEVVMRGARFAILGAAMGATVPLLVGTAAQLAGDGGGAVTPSRSGSDPAKALVLSRHGVRGGYIGALLVGEIVAEATLLPVCALIMVLALNVDLAEMGATLSWSVAALSLVGVAVWLAPTRDSSAPRLLQRLGVTGPRWERLVTIAADFRQAAGALRRISLLRLTLLAGATVAHIGARLLVLPALAGAELASENLAELLGWPFFLLYGAPLIPIPAGGGAIEAGFVYWVGDHLPAEKLGGLLFWWRFYTFHLFALAGWLAITISLRRRKPQGSENG